MLPQPGLFQELTGTDIHDFTFTSPAEDPTWADWNGQRLETALYNDILTALEGTDVLARYQSSYYAGEAALTEKRIGKGRVLHFGAAFTRDSVRQLLDYAGALEPFAGVVDAPEEVQVVMREKDGARYLFLLNYQPVPAAAMLKVLAADLYTGGQCTGEQQLPRLAPPYMPCKPGR